MTCFIINSRDGKMAKRRKTLKIRIPHYTNPKYKWRREIHEAVDLARKKNNVSYTNSDRLELNIRLYLSEKEMLIHDIDNRLKDILDALQGRAGGTKSIPTMSPIIPNDNQIYRVKIEKSPTPYQSLGLGHLTIRKLHKSTR